MSVHVYVMVSCTDYSVLALCESVHGHGCVQARKLLCTVVHCCALLCVVVVSCHDSVAVLPCYVRR